MAACDDEWKQQWNNMLGTIGDDSAFKEKLQALLVEIANDSFMPYSDASEDDEQNECNVDRKEHNEAANVAEDDDRKTNGQRKSPSPKKRSSIRIVKTKTNFVEEIMKKEQEPRLQQKYFVNLGWDFDPITFAKDVNDHPLVLLTWHIIKKNEFHQEFKVSASKLINFLYQIESAYNDNPYHNKYHAADVVNNVYWFLTQCSSLKKHITSFDIFMTVMAAAFHDVDHDAKTNAFHARIKSNLALRYNDNSILENHHVSYAFKLVVSNKDLYDWIGDLNDDSLIETARKYMIRLILGTDMIQHKKHGQHLENLKAKMKDTLSEDDKLDLLSIILHACDIANAAKPRNLCMEWARRCVGEFRLQGDEEKQRFGKESQPLFSRATPLEQSQPGWINYVMKPYYKPLNDLLNGDIQMLVDYLDSNAKQWTEYKEYDNQQ